MDNPLFVQELQCFQHLLHICLAQRLKDVTSLLDLRFDYALTQHVLQVYAEDIVLYDLTTIVLDNMLVIQLLVPIDFLLYSL